MLKVLKPNSDEGDAAKLLRYYNGEGAVRLYKSDGTALLMERAMGSRSLTEMASDGSDSSAATILADSILTLHRRKPAHPIPSLKPLPAHFASLFAREQQVAVLANAAAIARELFKSGQANRPLHGDLHHDNLLDGGPRGWLAIDPKGVLGTPAYEVANLLRNPSSHPQLVLNKERMARQAAFYAAHLGLDPARVLRFAFAHAGLSAAWDMEDGLDPSFSLACAETLEALIDA